MTQTFFPDSSLGEFILHPDAKTISALWPERQTVFITDKNVAAAHAYLFQANDGIVIQPGEENKNMDTIQSLYRTFLHRGVDRSWHIIGIGGGVICDLTGFAAATFMRGVSFSFVPSSLLAQVDAAVGGKNGCNFAGYKNLIGTFSIPDKVIFNFGLLQTLPRREITNGIAEIVKHACIADKNLFAFLERKGDQLLQLKPAAVNRAVAASLTIKSSIVKQDFSDQGVRHVLNFGHTLGHAVESKYGLLHGESVSLGIRMAVFVSHALRRLQPEEGCRIHRLMDKLGLPSRHDSDPDEIMDAVLKDKKKRQTRIPFIGLSAIGRAEILSLSTTRFESLLKAYLSSSGFPGKEASHA